jgi:hypothetical protein
MTRKALQFLAANKRSPIVYCGIIGKGGRGAIYRLADDSSFSLTRADCLDLPAHQLRWATLEKVA